MAGCPGTEIAGYFGMSADAFYRRTQEEHGIPFNQYSLEFYQKGDALLRAKQYAKALGVCTDGDNTMLVWLGKNRLKQKDKSDEEIEAIKNPRIFVDPALAIGANIPTSALSDQSNSSSQ